MSPQEKGEETVLVVEDDPSVRLFAQRVLEDAGFLVVTAEDGACALEEHARRPEVSAVLLDFTLPGLDGLETLRVLRGRSPRLPVVLMSGYTEQEIAGRCGETSEVGFLQKPFRSRELVERVRGLIRPRAGAED